MFNELDSDYDSFPFGWDFLVISIGFGNGFRKSSLFGIVFLPYWGGGVQLAMIYFSFLIVEIWFDRRGSIFLEIILFSIFA